MVYGISFAGHDPVTALMCNTLLCLLPRRDQWQALVDDPSLAANAVEETLRYESSQISWRRVTTQDTTLGNVDVPAGTRLMLNFASANHSPGHFENPDEFDITRVGANKHISFGKGIHFCLGAGLSRMEARIALELLAEHPEAKGTSALLRILEGDPDLQPIVLNGMAATALGKLREARAVDALIRCLWLDDALGRNAVAQCRMALNRIGKTASIDKLLNT
ncbi:MAG: cytochrome P450, partial [Actinomycetota bacterium]|nr:cytochrome P450 [Actinomycetota bacterium]